MKQRQYNEEQKLVMKVIEFLRSKNARLNGVKQLLDLYEIKPTYPTLREYLETYSNGSYITYHFVLGGKELTMNNISGFLDEELYELYPLTNKFYVVGIDSVDNGGDVENYHAHKYLALAPKED